MRITALLIVFAALLLCGCGSCDEPPSTALDFDELWDYADPAGMEVRFRALITAASTCGDVETHACLLTQIARAQGLQGKFADATETLDLAADLIGDGHTLARTRLLLERGRVLNTGGRREESIPLFEEALRVAESGGHAFFAVDAAHMLGIVEAPDVALAWNLKAIAMAEAAEEARARQWLGALYNNTGWTLHDQGRYDEALDLFEKALAWRRDNGGETEIRIARWCVARALRSLGRVDESLKMQRELLDEIESAGADPDGYVFEEIGECLLLLGKVDEAHPHFAKAYELLAQDRWLAANEKKRLERLKELGGGSVK